MKWPCWFGFVLLFLTTGCAINAPLTPTGDMCEFRSVSLDAPDPETIAGEPHTFAEVMRTALDPAQPRNTLGPVSIAPEKEQRLVSNSVLILSGGSEQGAFGAGFLDEWAHQGGGHLPRFSQVTGISTGAILATFAFVDETGSAVDGYAITNESQILNKIVPIKQQTPTWMGYIQMLKKGSLADLSPLDTWLKQHIPETMVDKVAREADAHRVLMIGVVDVDTGRARALDLTDMARRHAQAEADHDQATIQRTYNCYIKAIVASSSAPMAALPMFIDNRMYIDGGARFGMFIATASEALSFAAGEREKSATARRDSGKIGMVYVIVNGTQEILGNCGKLSYNDCHDDIPSWQNYGGQHAKWSFVGLAKRSEDILTNQVYRLSALLIETQAKQFRMVRIRTSSEKQASSESNPDKAETNKDPIETYKPYDPRQPGTTPDAFLDNPQKSCRDWTDYDQQVSDPLQFFPHYMHCLIQYGRTTERALKWENPK